jgi:succinate dehydrogenase / fumarate reductase, iron-sulfur subunit
VWRQAGPDAPGRFETYEATDISEDSSFLEMLDNVNEELIAEGEEPIEFMHDCREGICGTCGMMINGQAHGPQADRHLPAAHAVLQRRRRDRPRALAGVGVPDHQGPRRRPLGVRPDHRGRWLRHRRHGLGARRQPDPVSKETADLAMDAAACIGCGACVAACPNGAAQLFTAAKLAHLNVLPQGQPSATSAPRHGRGDGGALRVVHQHGGVRSGVPQGHLDRLHRPDEPDYLKAKFVNRRTA